MDSTKIRQFWIEFFRNQKTHLYQSSASLIPQNPTLLLTNAGMVPFVPFFLGREKPPSARIVSIQKCVRVGGKDSDLDNIGKTPRHLTFFEMMGNFSFGDYFKEEIIVWAWELLTKIYNFKPEDLLVSIFAGDERVPLDREAEQIWRHKVGIPEAKILKLGRSDNFWGPPGGISGPCGPCSEIYYCPTDGAEPIEIWNLVFMQYEQFEDGSLKPLTKPNVDTGAGLERIATILQGKESVFQTDLLEPVIGALTRRQALSEQADFPLASKVISDHLRCAFMLSADDVKPSNLGRGYVLRMLIRRAARYGRLLGIKEPFLKDLVPCVGEIFQSAYPEVIELEKKIAQEIESEESLFAETLEKGLHKFHDVLQKLNSKVIAGEAAFDLYATYGFPVELTQDLAAEKGLSVDLTGYESAREAHTAISNKGKFSVGFKVEDIRLKDLSPTEFIGYEHESIGIAKVLFLEKDQAEFWLLVLDRTPFYAESGGQVADRGLILKDQIIFEVIDVQKSGQVFVHKGKFKSDKIFEIGDEVCAAVDSKRRSELRKHHTCAHLLQAALREILGAEVQQAGSLVQPDRMRFDFTYPKGLTDDQIDQIEARLNEWIKADLPVETELLAYDQALAKGALAFFGDKYEDRVRVLRIGKNYEEAVSIELCGGTHVSHTAEIGAARLVHEASIAAGTRRVEVLAGESLMHFLTENTDRLESLAELLKTAPSKVEARFAELAEQLKLNEKKIHELEHKLSIFEKDTLLNELQTIDIKGQKSLLLVSEVEAENLRNILDLIAGSLQTESFVLFTLNKTKMSYACKVSKDLTSQIMASNLVKSFAELVGGSGGGRPDFAQGGSGDPARAKSALDQLKKQLVTEDG
ncbi:MAG: alanine--tRNA ligase [Candidatus Caenarcaniphilales bacterium]|nr:alanine--tRNA ligase [Candidatus Caenarcaniphilales bacterium]